MKILNSGKIKSIQDGVAYSDGLSSIGVNEMVLIQTQDGNNVPGIALNLKPDETGIIVIGDISGIREGDIVTTTKQQLAIEVSDSLLGRVINPLGEPIDSKGELIHPENVDEMLFEKIAPGVIEREDVSRPLLTGIKSIDAMVPIGKGQRELIIGDRQTGKTAIAIDTMINQKNKSKDSPQVKCIYVAIGQKASKIAQMVRKLEEAGALEYSIILLAGASDSAALQYLAPLAGTAIGEFYAQKGEDVLIIYDDLTKHAWAYREISLLLKRPPGREAYPGDIFYLHSSLLERSVQYSKELGGGSLTSLPIIETQAGDVSAYIPTNVISITDGQIYLETDLFNAGIKPAINVGLSVSRVGGAAQTKLMKKISGQLRLDMAQYRELSAFAQFGTDLDQETLQKLTRGEKMIELLKQKQYHPLPLAEQVALVYAGTAGYLDKIETSSIKNWQERFLIKLHQHKSLITLLNESKEFDNLLKIKLDVFINSFNENFI